MQRETSLLLDIGTNTKIFVGNSKDILSCSCASGPAFEGAHIKHGMKAVTGAIEKVSIEMVITQKDVNEVQLAKAAIFAGCWILMKRKNVKVNDIDQLLIARAFGSYINPENAKLIGLVPDVPAEKVKFVGVTPHWLVQEWL